MTARPSDRNRIQEFYRDVPGCTIVEKPDIDLVWLGKNFHIGFRYEDGALTDAELLRGLWLELRVDQPAALKKKILEFGTREIPYWDKEHFLFRLPVDRYSALSTARRAGDTVHKKESR